MLSELWVNDKIRPTDAFLKAVPGFIPISLYTGLPSNLSYWSPVEIWADGSSYSPLSGYTWPDHTSGHATPKNPDLTVAQKQNTTPFPQFQCTSLSWAWDRDMYVSFARGLGVYPAAAGYAFDALWKASVLISPLGWDDNLSVPIVLATAECDYDEHLTAPATPPSNIHFSFDATTTMNFSTGVIGQFNGVRATMNVSTPMYPPGSGPVTGYIVAASCDCGLYVTLNPPLLDVTEEAP